MESDVLTIAHIQRSKAQLPLKIDNSVLERIVVAVNNKSDILEEDRFYYDTIANKILSIAIDGQDPLTAAFLLIQLPLIHTEIIYDFLASTLKHQDPVAAFYAVKLIGSIDIKIDTQDFIDIIITKGDTKLWIESVRQIDKMPINAILQKIALVDSDQSQLWSNEIWHQALSNYNQITEGLKKPIDISRINEASTPSEEDISEEDSQPKINKVLEALKKPKALLSRSKNQSN